MTSIEQCLARARLPIHVECIEDDTFVVEIGFIGADGAAWLQREYAAGVVDAHAKYRWYVAACEAKRGEKR